jgi:hypothetical protein
VLSARSIGHPVLLDQRCFFSSPTPRRG